MTLEELITEIRNLFNRKVVISVKGGVAIVEECPEGVEVVIDDQDWIEDE